MSDVNAYPTTTDGDSIFINLRLRLRLRKREFPNGGIFVITLSDRTMIKRLPVMRNGGIKSPPTTPIMNPKPPAQSQVNC